ncbi:MAG: pyridoxal phosphate-dependent aminotransferase [Desulfosarcina sp.]|nr:pyridoxal phosphate-dependent aminotransferase [Desulfobacterales bacterium]
MATRLSDRINAIESSGTVQLTAALQKLRDQGVDVVDLAVGEPDFAIDPTIVDATSAALAAGLTRYGPVGGLPTLRKRIAADFEGYDQRHIIVTNGAKQALYNVFQVLCNDDDEIVIPSPCWVSFSHQVKLAGGQPVLVPSPHQHPDVAAIRQAIGPRTVAVLINSPNNPTGAVYPPPVIAAIGDICRQSNLWLISDEAYQAFDYSGTVGFSPFADAGLRERLIVIRSFSKTYGMTGFRVGFAAAPVAIVQAMNRLQSHLSGNVCTFAQHGALAALDLPAELIAGRRCQYVQRRDRAFSLTSGLFECRKPEGAFYLLPSISRYADRFASGVDLATRLLEQAHVAVVPGEYFYAAGHVRISFAAASDRLEEGFRRMREVLVL